MTQIPEAASVSALTEAAPSLTGGSPFGVGSDKVGNAEPVVNDVFDSLPRLGLFRTERHDYYWNGQGPFISVTTALDIIHKEALVQWIKWAVATAATNHADYLPLIKEAIGEKELRSWLATAPDVERDEAAKLGTAVHLLAEQETAATVQLVPEWGKPYLEAFRGFLAFLEARRGIIVSSEKSVLSLGDGYGGTYDLLLQIDGQIWLCDIKSRKGASYPEDALQLAGYGYAEFIALHGDPNPYPMPHIDRYAVLHLRPGLYKDTGWRLIEYPVTDRDYVAFLAALELSKWKGEGRFAKSKLVEPFT